MSSDAELARAFFDAAFAPVKDVFLRLLGPASDELGGIIADPIRAFRFRQSVRLLAKVKTICEETGFEPKAVPLKTLIPILEKASLEDNEDLHERWANLTANAANPQQTTPVHPSFPDILHQLSSRDARFLDKICDSVLESHRATFPDPVTANSIQRVPIRNPQVMLARLFAEAGLTSVSNPYFLSVMPPPSAEMDRVRQDLSAMAVSLDNLRRLRLIDPKIVSDVKPKFQRPGEFDLKQETEYHVTGLGFEFVSACRRPKQLR